MTQTEEKPVVVKTEDTGDSESEVSLMNQKLVAQIEYYFGDANLPRDRFIKEECSKHEGWFPVATLLKFNRVANLLKTIPNDGRVKAICEALKPSELVDVSEENLQIRRSPECPLPEKDSEERTIYLKGFHKTETTLDDLLEFFKKYEGVESVVMRYYKEKTIKTESEIKKEKEAENGNVKVKEEKTIKTESEIKKEKEAENGNVKVKEKKEDADESSKNQNSEPQLVWIRKFKGSVFVVCKTVEQAKKILDCTETVFQGSPIAVKMWQAEYKAMKTKEYQDKQASRKRKGVGDRIKTEGDAKEEDKDELSKGVLVKLLDIPEGFTREVIKERWYEALDKDQFQIAFIDFNRGDKNAILRLERENAAKEAMEKIVDQKLKMKDDGDVFSQMEGFNEEEEGKYAEEIKRQRDNRKRKPFGGRGGGGGRGGKRRRKF